MLIFQLAILVFGRRVYPLKKKKKPLHLCKGAPNRKTRLQEHGAVGRHKASVRVADHHDLTTKESTHHISGREKNTKADPNIQPSPHFTFTRPMPCRQQVLIWAFSRSRFDFDELEKNSGCHEGFKTGYPYDHRKMNLNSLWTHCFHHV